MTMGSKCHHYFIVTLAFLCLVLPFVNCVDEVMSEADVEKNFDLENEKMLHTYLVNEDDSDTEKLWAQESAETKKDDIHGNERIETSELDALPNELKKEEQHGSSSDMHQDQVTPILSESDKEIDDVVHKMTVETDLNSDKGSSDKEMMTDSEATSLLDSEINTESFDVKDSIVLDVGSTPGDSKSEQNTKKDGEATTKKQRYFPLLYTFGSLFTSFLAEFGEVTSSSEPSVPVNSSDSGGKNSSSLDGTLQDSNSTANGTDLVKKTRFQCLINSSNTTDTVNGTSEVRIINSTQLLEILNFSKNQKTSHSPCVLVMFYTKWCHFSAKAAPQYNALARAFPQLAILAVDTSHFSYLNAKFGTVAVPNIMMFHSRSAVRFNHTTRDLDNFIQFVTNNTGLEPVPSVNVTSHDLEGPLSSQVEQGRDWLLGLAWTFLIVCSAYGFFFSLYGQAVITRLRVLWVEHQHIE